MALDREAAHNVVNDNVHLLLGILVAVHSVGHLLAVGCGLGRRGGGGGGRRHLGGLSVAVGVAGYGAEVPEKRSMLLRSVPRPQPRAWGATGTSGRK